MRLSSGLHQFFDHYLPHIKGVSPHTSKAYRDTFKLLLPFAARYRRIKINSLKLHHLSVSLILAFLDDLERERKNLPRTRNHRLAALKSFAKMIRFMYPEERERSDRILHIPQKRTQKALVGFLYQEELLQIFQSDDLNRKEGFRDYALLHLLYDSGARASEISMLNLEYFNHQQSTLAILGKGDRYRLITLEPRTVKLLLIYITKYRTTAKPLYQNRLFIDQRREALTRHGIYRICRKYLVRVLPPKRLKYINPVHSFRHSRAVDMLYAGHSLSDIQNHLGHTNVQSTTVYLHLDLNRRRQIQQHFIEYMRTVVVHDPKIEAFLQGQNREDIMAWLDSL